MALLNVEIFAFESFDLELLLLYALYPLSHLSLPIKKGVNKRYSSDANQTV